MNDIWSRDTANIAANIADRRDNRGNERQRAVYRIGECVRLIGGKTVIIRGFKIFADAPNLPPWPFYVENGEEWPFNPDWVIGANAQRKSDARQESFL